MSHIAYDDLPKEELSSLRKKAFRENWSLRGWNAFAFGIAAFTALSIAQGLFPYPGDRMGRLIVGFLLTCGLAVIFTQAVVEPRIRRAVERMKKQSQPLK